MWRARKILLLWYWWMKIHSQEEGIWEASAITAIHMPTYPASQESSILVIEALKRTLKWVGIQKCTFPQWVTNGRGRRRRCIFCYWEVHEDYVHILQWEYRWQKYVRFIIFFFHTLGKRRAQRWVDIAGQGTVCNQVVTNIKIGENPFNCYVQWIAVPLWYIENK